MKLYNYPDAKQVLVSGDIHGDFKLLVYNLCIRFGCTDTLLIVAGDCGFGFEKPLSGATTMIPPILPERESTIHAGEPFLTIALSLQPAILYCALGAPQALTEAFG